MTFVLGFWGLHVEAEKQYTQEVDTSFRVSMASFGKKVSGNERSSVIAVVDGKEYVLCNLIPNKIEQQPLDVIFSMGEEITLYVTGKNEVFLTGNYIPDADGDDEEDDEDDEEIDSDELDMDSDEELDSEEEAKLLKLIAQDDEDIEYSDEDEEEEEEEEKPVPVKKVKEVANTKRKAEEVPVQTSKEKKNKKEKKEKKENTAASEPAVKKEEDKKSKATKSNRKELSNGLIIEDVETGTGPKATKGKRLAMRYIGRLMNGKVFDQNTKGKPFNFKLGKGEVIKGWDQGIDGMQLNGKRRLTIPPKLAYGARGAPPDIPANATLQFDIQLVGIN
ncbi:hypothetical protein BDF22DRAFT_691730 [Syncephalis plumigaleata]|nr:hypothetical protein BDF22DRAFT_691730 [Syncephalis plumigaleata]